jgi:hypothetical protein
MKQLIGNKRFSITRRNFIRKSAILGGTFAFSGTMSSFISFSDDPLNENGLFNKIVFSKGWKIQSIKPGDFTISGINNAGEWLVVPVVPAMPHEVLLHHKKIDEPWKPFGTEKCFWVSENDWVYLLDFSAENLAGE